MKSCLICTTSISVPHYGIDACRACAEFFKRAKLSGKKFVCRQGDKKCAIVKDERYTCRLCRYDRCVANGMLYEKGPEDSVIEQLIPNDPNDEEMMPSTSQEPEESILQRIGREFNASVDRRHAQEIRHLQDRPHIKFAQHPTQKLYWATFSSSLELFEATLSEMRSFYEQAFPEITRLSVKEQDALTRNCIPKFGIIDNAYRTRKMWGEIKDLVMCSVLGIVDFTRPDLWIGEERGGNNRQSLIGCIQTQNKMQLDFINPMMVRAHITDKEFYAVLALVLCDIEPSLDVSDETVAVTDAIRARVYKDLHRYYTEEMGLSDFSTRLGNLVSLNHAIQECMSASIIFMRLQESLFDLYSSGEKIKELIF
ncbi:hypothetical protein PFISCL1PPCAC_13691 [Pristionchus fissidentatus]|uniref:Nuclear receptor n=1 Tax=Pristionchus fissidentatus TaxID=1538716 RepID=A0AAV5VVJ0_9BILA|nr:hypothetical protein PFISCL1PPCAC_13691 [Pristionchus fissidentatus]